MVRNMTIAIKILCRKLISSKLEKTHSDTDIRDNSLYQNKKKETDG